MKDRIAKILQPLPLESQYKVLKAAQALNTDRLKRALKWREILGIKEGNRLVDDAKHLP
jgi:hypothetical protein